MNLHLFLILATFTLFFQSCIGDDFVEDNIEPVLSCTNPVDTLAFGSNYQFEFQYLNNIGREETIEVNWQSSDTSVITINNEGLASANAQGNATITLKTLDGTTSHSKEITVGQSTVLTQNDTIFGRIQTTTFYELKGDFAYSETNEGVLLEFMNNYSASSSLPGLYIYLSNNPNSIGNAFEIGSVEVFSGAHHYNIVGVSFDEYRYIVYFCKPFNVKVGDGQIQ